MSRSGYVDDLGDDDPLALGRWRAAVKSAIGGKRGQAMLRELLAALDAMQDKRLVADSLMSTDGEYCALGVLGSRRGIDLKALDPQDYDQVAAAFGVNAKVVQEVVFENDERNYRFKYLERHAAEVGPPAPWFGGYDRIELDESAERWRAMRAWVAQHIKGGEFAPSKATA